VPGLQRFEKAIDKLLSLSFPHGRRPIALLGIDRNEYPGRRPCQKHKIAVVIPKARGDLVSDEQVQVAVDGHHIDEFDQGRWNWAAEQLRQNPRHDQGFRLAL
jgi:hypothetical protein